MIERFGAPREDARAGPFPVEWGEPPRDVEELRRWIIQKIEAGLGGRFRGDDAGVELRDGWCEVCGKPVPQIGLDGNGRRLCEAHGGAPPSLSKYAPSNVRRTSLDDAQRVTTIDGTPVSLSTMDGLLAGRRIMLRFAEHRGALPAHSTPVVDRPWYPGAVASLLPSSGGTARYQRAYAFQGGGPPNLQSSYGILHHEISPLGRVGPANVRAVMAGISLINGNRDHLGLSNVDVQAVYEHLAGHMRDSGAEPPALRHLRVSGVTAQAVLNMRRRSWS